MQKIDIKKAAGVSALSLALVVGVAGFAGASSGTIGTTGANSENEISHETSVEWDVDNDTDLDLTNKSHQYASSGDVEVKYNTTGGDAETGDATNSSSVSADIEVDNSSAASGAGELLGDGSDSNSGSITNTGYNSENEVEFKSSTEVDINNDTDVDIYNHVDQKAKSGDAEVRYNTTGGDAISGNVSNTSTSSFTVRVTN